MPLYKCPRCHYSTGKYSNMKTHLKRKNPCPPKFSNEVRESLLNHKESLYGYPMLPGQVTRGSLDNLQFDNCLYYCRYCNKPFKHCSGRSRHESSRCPMRKVISKSTEVESSSTFSVQGKKNVVVSNTHGTTNIDNSTINNQQINQINNIDNSKYVNVNNYGEEDLSHLTDDMFTEMIKNPYSAMSRLIKAIHFNDTKPENQNLRIPNKKEPFIETFSDGEWVVGNQYKHICKAYFVKKDILHEAFLRIKSMLDKKTRELYNDFYTDTNTFTIESQLKDVKAAIISGTRQKPALPSRYMFDTNFFEETDVLRRKLVHAQIKIQELQSQ